MWSPDRPVLVTGAGGFIGGRLVEALHSAALWPVRASVRRWSSAVRIGRLPVEIVLCDVTNREQVRSAMEGAGAVIHCAYGGGGVTLEGTRNVMEAALDAGVAHVIHLSTMEVYGDVEGEISETAPLLKTGWDYRDTKIEAELLCRRFMDRGLGVTVLRPTLVYGPFSRNWTVEFARRLVEGGTFPSRDDAQGFCNLVYVDDLAAAVLRSLGREEAVGEAFNVNGEERLTWWEYVSALNDALALPPLESGGRLSRRIRSLAMSPVRTTARFALNRFGGSIVALYQHSPLAQRAMRRAEASIRGTPSQDEYRLFRMRAFFGSEKAKRILGHECRFALSRGVSMSAMWLRHHGFLGAPQVQEG